MNEAKYQKEIEKLQDRISQLEAEINREKQEKYIEQRRAGHLREVSHFLVTKISSI